MNNKLLNGLRKASLIIFSTCAAVSVSTAVTPAVKGTLPSAVVESSGLAYSGGTTFWTHNDGYGDENLYQINGTGALIRTVEVLGAVNHDWEDLAEDQNRTTLFIGDFGNNNCDRTNLRIYKIPHPSTISGSTVTAETIHFTYPDQTSFPSPWMNFDVESFFHWNGKLYLFTKTDGSAIGYTKMYTLPDQAGTYVATLVDSFYTNDRTTSADISPDGLNVILIANSRIHVFKNFTGDDFFGGQHTLISISGAWTQKEAVTFSSNNEIYMSDEDNGAGSKLFYIDMSPWIPSYTTTGISRNIPSEENAVYPNPANSYFIAQLNSTVNNSELKLYDLTGQVIRQVSGDAGVNSLRIETAALPAGVYFYKLFIDHKEIRTSRLVISH